MNALLHTFTRHAKRITDRPAALDSTSWPIRLEGCRGTAWERCCLLSIERDADAAGDEQVRDAARYALDTGELDELDYWFAFAAGTERILDRARSYELATGKDAPDTMLAGEA